MQNYPTTLCARKWDDEHFRWHLQRLEGIKHSASDIYKIQNTNRKLLDECNRLRNHNPKKLAMQKLKTPKPQNPKLSREVKAKILNIIHTLLPDKSGLNSNFIAFIS